MQAAVECGERLETMVNAVVEHAKRLQGLESDLEDLRAGARGHAPEPKTFAEAESEVGTAKSMFFVLADRCSRRSGDDSLKSREAAELDTAIRKAEHKLQMAVAAAQKQVRAGRMGGGA